MAGRHAHWKYQLGDDEIVKIIRSNLEKKQLDFLLVMEKTKNKDQFFLVKAKKT